MGFTDRDERVDVALRLSRRVRDGVDAYAALMGWPRQYAAEQLLRESLWPSECDQERRAERRSKWRDEIYPGEFTRRERAGSVA